MDFNYLIILMNSAIRSTTPIMMAALASAICERSGVFNVALEGQMLIGCFIGIAVNFYTHSVTLAVLCAILSGGLIGLLVGVLQVRYKAADIVVGTSVNLFVGGITAVLLFIWFGVKGSFKDPALISLPKVELPLIGRLPVVSVLLRNLTVMDYLAYIIAVSMFIYLFKTVWGYHLISVGLKREAAESMGLRSQRTRIMAVAVSGLLCGFGGVVLCMGQVNLFAEGMTAGRGYIGMAACSLGRKNPAGIMLSSLFFGLCDAFASLAQNSVPSQLTQSLPYIATIIALIMFSREKKPKAKTA